MELSDFIFDYTLRNVALGSAILGVVSGVLGSFAVLRKQSLIGDAISHAALPGIVLAFLLTGAKSPVVLLLGATAIGLVAMLSVNFITDKSRIKFDTALGLILSVFFGFGLVLLTLVQSRPDANQAGLTKFLFGQAAALVQRDVIIMLVVGILVLLALMMNWKQFKVLAFDPEFGASLGLNMPAYNVLLTALLVVAIVIGLQTVGVVLMSAMIIAPGAAARQWTNRLGSMVLLASFFGAAAGVIGASLSSVVGNLPTGPMVILTAGVIVVISLFLAPERGIIPRYLRDWRNGRRLRSEAVLLDLFALAHQHASEQHPHSEIVLDVMSHFTSGARLSLNRLREMSLVEEVSPRTWSLTETGVERARELLRERGMSTGP